MSRTALYGAATVLLAAGVLTIVTAASLRPRDPDLTVSKTESQAIEQPLEWMTEYTLTERSGRLFHSEELQGKVHVVNFFFATCPSVCRMQSGKVGELAEEFGPQGAVFLSITCDPERDTPAALQQYAQMFDADPEHWLFLTSPDLTYLRRVGGEVYQLPVDKQTHSENFVVLDKGGEIRGRFHWDQPKELFELRKTLNELLTEEAPAADAPATADELKNDEDYRAADETVQQGSAGNPGDAASVPPLE